MSESAKQQGLVFYEKSHRYKLDGKWVPGVTTLIKEGLPARQLIYWAAKTVAEYVADNPEQVENLRGMGRNQMVAALKETPWQRRDEAAFRGTEVHRFAEQLVAGHTVEVPDGIAGYVDACASFMDDWGVEPLVVERPVAHRAHWWAGTPDVFATVRGGRRVLFDYKSGKGVYAEAAFQLAAYRHAEFYLSADGTEQPVPEVDMCAAVHLNPEGYDVIPLKADTDVYTEFRHIAAVARAAKRAKGGANELGYVGLPIDPEGAVA